MAHIIPLEQGAARKVDSFAWLIFEALEELWSWEACCHTKLEYKGKEAFTNTRLDIYIRKLYLGYLLTLPLVWNSEHCAVTIGIVIVTASELSASVVHTYIWPSHHTNKRTCGRIQFKNVTPECTTHDICRWGLAIFMHSANIWVFVIHRATRCLHYFALRQLVLSCGPPVFQWMPSLHHAT